MAEDADLLTAVATCLALFMILVGDSPGFRLGTPLDLGEAHIARDAHDAFAGMASVAVS